jgi:hypothetical protein
MAIIRLITSSSVCPQVGHAGKLHDIAHVAWRSVWCHTMFDVLPRCRVAGGVKIGATSSGCKDLFDKVRCPPTLTTCRVWRHLTSSPSRLTCIAPLSDLRAARLTFHRQRSALVKRASFRDLDADRRSDCLAFSGASTKNPADGGTVDLAPDDPRIKSTNGHPPTFPVTP